MKTLKITNFALLLALSLPLIAAEALPEGQGVEEEEALSGRELLDGCEEGAAPGAPNQYCMRYIFGLVQVVDSFQQADPTQPKVFCIDPTQVSLQEVTETTTDWLKQQPARLDEDAYKLVTEALNKNYPCSMSKI
jgi:hypothetical protein